VPVLLALLLDEFAGWRNEEMMWVFAGSPVAPIGYAETGHLDDLGIGPVILNFTVTALLLYVLRRRCLKRAEKYLRRE
jgi:hypothetical protein